MHFYYAANEFDYINKTQLFYLLKTFYWKKNFHPRLKGNMVCIILENNDKINISILGGRAPGRATDGTMFQQNTRAYC